MSNLSWDRVNSPIVSNTFFFQKTKWPYHLYKTLRCWHRSWLHVVVVGPLRRVADMLWASHGWRDHEMISCYDMMICYDMMRLYAHCDDDDMMV